MLAAFLKLQMQKFASRMDFEGKREKKKRYLYSTIYLQRCKNIPFQNARVIRGYTRELWAYQL